MAATSPGAGFSPAASAAWVARSRWPPPWPAPRCSPSSASRRRHRDAPQDRLSRRRHAKSLDEALQLIERSTRQKEPLSVGLLGNAAEIFPELVKRGVRPDAVTDQTSAHDPLHGYLPAGWTLAGMVRPPGEGPGSRRQGRQAEHGPPGPGDARLPQGRRPHPRLRQQYPPDGEGRGPRARLRLPGLRPGLYPPALLPRHRPLPLGRALRRSRGHLQDRRQGQGGDPRRPAPPQLARHGEGADQVPGPARPHLLGRPRPPPQARPRLQRDGAGPASSRPPSSSAATTSIPARSPAPTARPRP